MTNVRTCSLRIKATFTPEVRDIWSHPWPVNWATVERVIVYYAQAALAFGAGIKY